MKNLRKVKYFNKLNKDKDNDEILDESDCIGTALFHKFGVDYEDVQTDYNNYGTGMFSTAIIELEDGTIKNVYVELIKFIK